MIRKQVYITDELDEELKRLAARTGKAEAEHVRAALRRYLAAERVTPERDPLLALIGLAGDDDGPSDAAVNHDHYLYGAPKIRE